MKNLRRAWLAASLLALPGTTLAQTTSANASSPPLADSAVLSQAAPSAPASSPRPVLGGPPQPVAAEPRASADLDLLQQLPLAPAGQLLPAEMAQVFPQGVRQVAGFRPDVAALATATVVAGSRTLVALSLPLGAAGVPAGGATPGQRLKLLTPTGPRLVAVARPAAAGSHTLVVSAEAGLVGQSVFVVGFERPAELAIDYEALARLSLAATQQLARQLAAVQQQLAALHDQLAAAQQVNSALLLDHAEQADLKQQLHLLLSQQAAAFSAGRQRRTVGWSVE